MQVWLDLASTYSYLASVRIAHIPIGLPVTWRPFTLGPIFAAQGWTTSPFNLQAAKGAYMWRDMERSAVALGIPFTKPSVFPRNSVPAMKIAVLGCDREWGPAFCTAVLRANFGEDREIAEASVIDEVLSDLELDAAAVRAESESPEWKGRLRAQTEEAARRGIFGAPTFVVEGELFWGNDRLEEAIAWAVKG
ncbi:MAG TPA: 2-hydroxychromene-2-carboxylate isomerase [Kofleriaceae bacterium]|jgi:2-hydroxychromene-2-carboxylate isomerase